MIGARGRCDDAGALVQRHREPERFGVLVSESGAGYAWCGNSRENQLHAWSNDPVSDAASDAIYLRDEETGAYWSPTPGPVRLGDTR